MLTVPQEICPSHRPASVDTRHPQRARDAQRWRARSQSSCTSSIPRRARSSARSPLTSPAAAAAASTHTERARRLDRPPEALAATAGADASRGLGRRGTARPVRRAVDAARDRRPVRSVCRPRSRRGRALSLRCTTSSTRAPRVEVKSTAGAQHQVLQISSERQLDDTGTERPVSRPCLVDARQGGTETLPELVAAIRGDNARHRRGSSIRGAPGASGLPGRTRTPLHDRLHAAARRGIPRPGGFPRIVESDLQDGVGDVRYSVAVTECRDWERPLAEVAARLGGSSDG